MEANSSPGTLDRFDPLFVRRVYQFAGCVGGAAGVLVGHPLDTVKVRLQVQPRSIGYRGTYHCLASCIKHEGVRGLYKGMSSPLVGSIGANLVAFGVQGRVMRNIEDKKNLKSLFLAGAAAGVAQSFIAAPSDRVKLLIQLQYDRAHTKYNSPKEAFGRILQKHGFRGLMRGYWATLARDCPACGIYFASYEWMTRSMSPNGRVEELSSYKILLAGGCAGIFSWLFNYPTDVVKTRFQADSSYTTYAECIKKLYATNGYKAFYAGLGSTLIRAFPVNAATFFAVEWIYRLMFDINILNVGTQMETHYCHCSKPPKRHYLVLPEAGGTWIDPPLHGCFWR